MSIVHLVEILVAAHVVTGAVGLMCVGAPIVGREGGVYHKR